VSYQVTIQLDFEEEPTDEDVWNRLREFADQTKVDFVVAPPFEPPFDDPVARDRISTPFSYRFYGSTL
jgi:hypothetical protein